jgi:uncharacterized protein YkwD
MLRVRIAALVALCTCLLAALPATAGAMSPTRAMLAKVNAFRARHGVPRVRYSASLAGSAARYSRYMMRHHYFGHSSHIHASRRFRTLGEIIEMQRGPSAGVNTAFQAWLHSPPHRSIILMSTFKLAGAGYVSGRFQGHEETIWTMHFGRP